MAAYLVVDVDDLLARFRDRGMSVDLQELAVGLRGGAALAAGLVSADKLKAIAVANWKQYSGKVSSLDPQVIFKAAGYETFDVESRDSLADVLIIHYFSYDPDPINELILATTSRDLLPLIRRIKVTRSARIRMWGSEDVLKGTEFADEIIFQPLETLLGIQSKNVIVYIDFENIAISLNEQGFVVNLDHLIEQFVARAKAHGQVIKMNAYAPWGQRGTLPPMVDNNGREVADDAPQRLMMANIDPVFTLPGKNSADLRIARDVMMDASMPDGGDLLILASGDRDFNDVINSVIQRGKSVIIWGVRGSTSRQLANHPSVSLEYIEDFTELQTHQSLTQSPLNQETAEAFVPTQWSSLVIQYDRLSVRLEPSSLTTGALIDQLVDVGVVANRERGDDLVSQALALGVLRQTSDNGSIDLADSHPLVEKTRLIAEAITRRVANTLSVRGWEYVNYGFLLKGLEMERDISRPGMNSDDQWRSLWIDALVRERLLVRMLVPHRHNPDDLVPVIRLPENFEVPESSGWIAGVDSTVPPEEWEGKTLAELSAIDEDAAKMVTRVVVSVEQFTSFRNFAWCPLGSLHRRLRPFDPGMAFQRAVEYLEANGAVDVSEYPNPQSDYNTKGISVIMESAYTQKVLGDRDTFIQMLLDFYDNNQPITRDVIQRYCTEHGYDWDVDLWVSIMETENVLNPLPGRAGHYSLFRTHHTVKLVAGDSSDAG